jgi:hypothetical protein
MKIRVLCGKENIWMSVDETTNASRRKVSDVIVVLENDRTLSEKSFVLSCQKMSAVNHTKITSVYADCNQIV